jgi:hypothetical protein
MPVVTHAEALGGGKQGNQEQYNQTKEAFTGQDLGGPSRKHTGGKKGVYGDSQGRKIQTLGAGSARVGPDYLWVLRASNLKASISYRHSTS